MAKETRTRSWTFVLYPESAPEQWRSMIDEMHVEWAESPLHEFDVNPTGEVKKPHWHILISFQSVKSYDQVAEMIKPLCGTVPQRCHNAKALIRYFAHLDNPEKHQYNITEIIGHGGLDVSELLRPSSSERYTYIKEMMEYVESYMVTEFYELLDYAMEEKFDTWFPLLCDNSAYIVNQYIKSNRTRVFANRNENTDFGVKYE